MVVLLSSPSCAGACTGDPCKSDPKRVGKGSVRSSIHWLPASSFAPGPVSRAAATDVLVPNCCRCVIHPRVILLPRRRCKTILFRGSGCSFRGGFHVSGRPYRQWGRYCDGEMNCVVRCNPPRALIVPNLPPPGRRIPLKRHRKQPIRGFSRSGTELASGAL